MSRRTLPGRHGLPADVYAPHVGVIGAGALPPIPGAEEWDSLPGPSRAEAASWLRLISVGLALAMPEGPKREREENLARYRLRRIADCIERTARWRKGAARPPGDKAAIEIYARLVDQRDPSVPLTLALDAVARVFARDRAITDPNGEQKARDAIAEARRRQRK